MRRSVFFALLVLTSLACNTVMRNLEPARIPPTATIAVKTPAAQANLPSSEDDVPRISAEEAKAAFDGGEAILLDVRSAEAFDEGHAKGAMNFPLGRIELDPGELRVNQDRWIITYCT